MVLPTALGALHFFVDLSRATTTPVPPLTLTKKPASTVEMSAMPLQDSKSSRGTPSFFGSKAMERTLLAFCWWRTDGNVSLTIEFVRIVLEYGK